MHSNPTTKQTVNLYDFRWERTFGGYKATFEVRDHSVKIILNGYHRNQLMFAGNWLLRQILRDLVLDTSKLGVVTQKQTVSANMFYCESPSRTWVAAVRMVTLLLKSTKDHEMGTLKCHQDGFYLKLLGFCTKFC